MGWQDEARRTIIGDKVDLNSFPGYWIRPRKYSIETMDKIKELQKKQQSDFNGRTVAKIAKKAKSRGELEKLQNLPITEIMDYLTEDEFAELYQATEQSTKAQLQITVAKIAGGVGEHNFDGVSVDQLAKDIVEYSDIAIEMVQIADEFNRPLAMSPSGISGPSPDGSTGGGDSNPTVETSPTAETPGI